MSLTSERILVTGAGGFVGANLCKRLLGEEAHVFAWIHERDHAWRLREFGDRLTVQEVDIRDGAQVRQVVNEIEPRIIYHLATHGAYHHQQGLTQILETNVLGFSNLLQACTEVGFRLFVNTGSSSEYGRKSSAMRETDNPEPNSFYAVSKVAQSLLGQHCARADGLPIVTLRLFSVYGPYEEPGRLFPTITLAALHDEPISMVSPKTSRDFIHVDDVVDAYLKVDALAESSGEILNIGSGRQTSMEELIDTLRAVAGKPLDVSWNTMEARIWDADTWVGDNAKARERLNWTPQIALADGLRQNLEWFSAHLDAYERVYRAC